MILDASALLALLHQEPGAQRVQDALDGALVCSVNWSEVLQKVLQRGIEVDGMEQDFTDMGVLFQPFTLRQAALAAQLWGQARRFGLSFADRACLALALDTQQAVVTADKAWADLDLKITVELIR